MHQTSPAITNTTETRRPSTTAALDRFVTSSPTTSGSGGGEQRLDGSLELACIAGERGGMNSAKDPADPAELGFSLSDALHSDGDGSLFSVSHAMLAREAGARSWRREEERLRATYRIAQPWLLAPRVFAASQRTVDKAFCSVWLGSDSVLVGTKCNNLLLLDVVTGRHRRVPLPPKPALRLGPELMHNPDGHCGMHAVDVSPDGRYVVTGGRAAEDALVLRRSTMTPVRTFSGHADWVFGLAWVTESHFVSCSRDGTIKLWCVGQPGEEGYVAEAAAPLASVLDNKRAVVKQRDIRCWVPDGRIVSLGVDGSVVTWDSSLRQMRKATLEGARELICLAVQDRLVAAGSRSHMHLLDLRQRCSVVGTMPVTDNGVRSLQLAGHVLSAGTGDANLVFYDLRYLRHARGPRLRDLAEEDDPFDAVRGQQPLELGHLEMPTSTNNVQDTWGWVVRDTVYTHCWDRSGTRLFMAGGPLAVGLAGCSMSVWL
ncbi:MAG: WD40-repeat-containing domain protein [Monoraphidium minutum]|nr:MAG: WD40-repeat-containing domain protein [Monoraphidium minutum]